MSTEKVLIEFGRLNAEIKRLKEKIEKMRAMLEAVKIAHELIAADTRNHAGVMYKCRTKDILILHSAAHEADAKKIGMLLEAVK